MSDDRISELVETRKKSKKIIELLKQELKSNKEVLERTKAICEKLPSMPEIKKRPDLGLLSLNTNFGMMLINQGYLFLCDFDTKKFQNIYFKMSQINDLIEYHKIASLKDNLLLLTPLNPEDDQVGYYVPSLLANEIKNLIGIIDDFLNELS